MNDIFEFLIGTICILLIFTMVIFFILGLFIGINYIDYYLNKTNCVVKVGKNIVYKGNSHFIELDSIGENGNTKNLRIYKDKTKMILIKNYVSNDITVTESEGN